MKRFISTLAAFIALPLAIFADTFSPSRIHDVYHEIIYDQESHLYEAGLTSPHIEPTPYTGMAPAPKSGMLPVVITNDTGLPANQVYVTLAGQQVAGSTEYFFKLDTTSGNYTPIMADDSTYCPNFSYLLSTLPQASTGANDYLVYTPALAGARFYFSINRPIYLQANSPNNLAPPTYYAFYDPNYNNLFESVELTFKPTGGGAPPAIPWTASVNTTEVDAFCLPIRIGYYSYNPSNPNAVTPMTQDPNALPSGFGVGGLSGATTRETILTSVYNGLDSGDQSGANPKVWPRLAIPFYSDPYNKTGFQTYIRILSPKQGLGLTALPQAQNPPPAGSVEIGNLTR